MIKTERRGMLRGLMATALAAPLAQMMRMHNSVAAPRATAVPKVVFFYTPCGVLPDLWHPQQTGTTFTLPMLSAPLAPYQSECIFIDGVSMYLLNDHQGGSQQLKLDTFTASLRELERRLTDPGTIAPSCSDVSGYNPTHFTFPQVGDTNQASYNHTAHRGVVDDLQM